MNIFVLFFCFSFFNNAKTSLRPVSQPDIFNVMEISRKGDKHTHTEREEDRNTVTQNATEHSDIQRLVKSSQLCKSDKMATSKRKVFAL